MSQLVAAVRDIATFFGAHDWQYCVVGGMAVPRWGESRPTLDVDICLLAGLGEERDFIEPVLASFQSRIGSPAAFAEQNRVLLVQAPNGTPLDIALGWTPFEERMLARATLYDFGEGVLAPTPTAEDLVVMKAFAGRSRDWTDVTGILARLRGKLDWDSIVQELSELCEMRESRENLDVLLRLREQIDAE